MTGALNHFVAAGVGFFQSVNGEPFTLRGEGRTGVISDLTQSAPWGEKVGGAKPEYRCRIVFPIPPVDFSPELRVGEGVTARGKTLQISAISRDATQITITLVQKL